MDNFRTISHEEVTDFIAAQLAVWPLAKRNHDALAGVERRALPLGDLEAAVQWNPARIVSTGAKTAAADISARPCFLCGSNRPAEQMVFPILEGWEMLVNPYPIFPVHLTLASSEHRPQERVPMDIVDMAERLPGMAVFFNGARAGASAPDHLHLQAVLKDELPLLRLAEKCHPASRPGLRVSTEFGLYLPFTFFSGVVEPAQAGIPTLMSGLNIGGRRTDGRLVDPALVNTFFWMGSEGLLRFVVVPRTAHRPECYPSDGGEGLMVSPGCIDMAGVVVTPREEDFRRITADDIRRIYKEVAVV